jgi:hypothetical protein
MVTDVKQAQAGVEVLPCGCHVNRYRPGRATDLYGACEDIAASFDDYRKRARKLTIGSSAEDIEAAQKSWDACKKHIAASRRWARTGKPPNSATQRGYGT